MSARRRAPVPSSVGVQIEGVALASEAGRATGRGFRQSSRWCLSRRPQQQGLSGIPLHVGSPAIGAPGRPLRGLQFARRDVRSHRGDRPLTSALVAASPSSRRSLDIGYSPIGYLIFVLPSRGGYHVSERGSEPPAIELGHALRVGRIPNHFFIKFHHSRLWPFLPPRPIVDHC